MVRITNKSLLTEQELSNFNELYYKGLLPIRVCADKMGYNYSTLMYKLRKLNIQLRDRAEAISLAVKTGRRNLSGNNNPNYKNGLSVEQDIGQRWSKYGLSKEDFYNLLEKQGNKCGICSIKFTDTPHIDHDHSTEEVRGLLCKSCNIGLGNFKDNPDLLRSGIKYLEEKVRWFG